MWAEPRGVWEGSRFLPVLVGSARLDPCSVSARRRLPFGSVRFLSERREAAGPAQALSAAAALRALLCLVFSLPSLPSCIRVVAFPIVSAIGPRLCKFFFFFFPVVFGAG